MFFGSCRCDPWWLGGRAAGDRLSLCPLLLGSAIRRRCHGSASSLVTEILWVLFVCVRFENANEVLKAAQRLKYVFLAAVPPSFGCGTFVAAERRLPQSNVRGPLPL